MSIKYTTISRLATLAQSQQAGPQPLYQHPKLKTLLTTVAKQLSSGSDKALRSAALQVLETVYEIETSREAFWRHLPRISDQQRDMIEERLKYVQKTLDAQPRDMGGAMG